MPQSKSRRTGKPPVDEPKKLPVTTEEITEDAPEDTPPETTDPEEQENLPDLSTANLPENGKQKIYGWFARNNISFSDVTMTLYKLKTVGGNWVQCGKWVNEVPEEHDIGLIHGSGKYVFYAVWPGNGIKKFPFELDKIYDTYQREAAASGTVPDIMKSPAYRTAPPACAPVASSPSQQNSAIGDLAALIAAISPLVKQQAAPQQDVVGQFSMMNALMQKTFESTLAAMKNSVLSNADFYADMQSRLLDLKEQQQGQFEEEPLPGENTMPQIPEKPKTFFEQALPYIAPLLGKLVGASPEEIRATAGVVDSIPAVKEMISNPKNKEDCKNLISYLDKNIGEKAPGKVDQILKALHIDRAAYN